MMNFLNLRTRTAAQRFETKEKSLSKYGMDTKLAVYNFVKSGKSCAKAAEVFGINNRSTVRKWCQTLDNGGSLSEFHGRRQELSPEDLVKCAQEINVNSGKGYAMKESEAKEVIASHIRNSKRKRNILVDDDFQVSNTSIRSYLHQMEAHEVIADPITEARRIAEENVNNAVGFCAGICGITPYIDSRMIGNVDASQYVYALKSEKSIYCGKQKEYVKYTTNIKGLPGEKDEGGLGFGIKYYCCITSGGIAGSPIYIVANKHMPDDDIDVYKVNNFGWGVTPAKFSYLVFMQTRTPKKSFYRWFITDYLIPFVTQLRLSYEIDSYFFMQLDGETDQIEVYNNTELLELLKQNKIAIAKSSASRTALEQPCDVGNIFKGSKTRFRNSLYNQHKFAIPQTFTAYFYSLWTKNHIKYSTGKKNYDHQRKALSGIYLINRCLERTVNSDVIIESFEKTGMHNKVTTKPDMYVMLKRCRTSLNDEDLQEIVHKMPVLVQKILNQRVLYDDVDFKGISKACKMKSRDKNKRINSKGYMFLTDPKLVMDDKLRQPEVIQVVNDEDESLEIEIDENLVLGMDVVGVDVVEQVAEVDENSIAVLPPKRVQRDRKKVKFFDE